jgi:glycosyltransferase involved in cell wall biosynthesis
VSAEPLVSVVVPTHNRRHLLKRLIGALEAQERAPSIEVIIVDDASSDGTADELEGLATTAGIPLVRVHLDVTQGPAAARNAGWRRARGSFVAFTDDDCIPQPGWLAALAAALADADVVQGRTLPDPDQMEHRNAFSHSSLVEDEWGFYEACNMGYRRQLLEQLGGFDESFRKPFGEDTDLAWRAKRSAARVIFDASALVFHDVRHQTYLEHLRDLFRREGVVRAIKRNPEMRRLCRYGLFWRPAHPSALAAAIGLASAAAAPTSRTRWVAAAALSLPYIRYRTRTFPTGRPRNRPVVIPLALASDLVEISVLAVASVRYRTLVL